MHARRPERAPVDAADAAGREHPDPALRAPRSSSPRRSCRPSRRTRSPRRGWAARPCAPTRGRRRELLELVARQAHEQPALVERDRRRHGAARSGSPASDAVATSTLCGYASPWLMSVDSRATTGIARRERVGDLGGDGEAVGRDHGTEGTRGPARAPAADGTRSARSTLTHGSPYPALAPHPPPARAPTLRDQVVLEEHDVAAGRLVRGRLPADGRRGRATSPTCGWSRSTAAQPRRLTNGASPRQAAPRLARTATASRSRARSEGHDDPVLMLLDLAGGEPAVPRARRAVRRASSPGRPTAAASRSPRRPARRAVPRRRRSRRTASRRAPRHITTIDYRWDEEDYLDRRAQLFVVAAHEGARRAPADRRSTGGVAGIAWRPDGRAIAFVADPRPDADRSRGPSIWGSPPAGGAGGRRPRAARDPRARRPGQPDPAFSPRRPLARGRRRRRPGRSSTTCAPTLFVGPADGVGRRAVALAPDLDRPIGHWTDTRPDRLDGRRAGRARPGSMRGGRRARDGPRADAPVALPRRPDDGPADRRAATRLASGGRHVAVARGRRRRA